jgi:hypothetical protein
MLVMQFHWMAETLRLMTLDELKDSGVTVYQAPKVPKRSFLVNLMNGIVVNFSLEGEMPTMGHFAKLDEIKTLADRYGLGLVERDRKLEVAWEREAAEV